MSVYFTSDWHLSHTNLPNFRKYISSPEENEKLLVEAYEKIIKKQDVVWFLGDVAFDKRGLDVIGNLKGRKRLILGNHDLETTNADQMAVFEEIHGMVRYKKMWLTHCPIHPDEMRRCVGNLCGHIHDQDIMKKTWYGKKVLDKKYLNCCVDAIYRNTGRFFYTLDEAKKHFNI
jgi:calcineurin-like phosphoesterase family protein